MLQDIITLYQTRGVWFLELLIQHIRISATAIAIAAALGLALGVWISEHKRFSPVVLGATNIIYTVPSIAMLGLLIPLTGVGNATAIIALSVYALLPMVRNTYTGIEAIDPEIVEAAKGMGSTRAQILLRVKLPLALSVIVAGLRSMVVMTVALTGIASFIGAGGLGVAIYRGITTYNMAMTYAGSILIALLALACDFSIGRVERHIKRKRRLI